MQFPLPVLHAGLAPVKVNAVVHRGINEHTVLDLLENFRGTPVTVRLIEYMDVGNRNRWDAGDSDGMFHTCLFATTGTDLRGPLRAGATDEQLPGLLAAAWTRYSEQRAELREQSQALRKIEMHYIGG